MAKHLPQPEVKSPPAINPAPDQERSVQGEQGAEGPGQIGRATATAGRESLATKNSNGPIDQFFPLPKRVPIQIFNKETSLQKLGYLGPTLLGLVSVVLTMVVFAKTQELTKELTGRQIDLQKEQNELQNSQMRLQREQVEAELADLRFKFLNDLMATDESKTTPAEIGLAAHGMKAFPVVHFALGVEQGRSRRSAVNVVNRMFQSEKNDGREQLLASLMSEFSFPNPTLHIGVVQSFVKIEPLLSPAQRADVINFLQCSVVPPKACSTQKGRDIVFETAKFIGSIPDANPYLLSIVNDPSCGNGWVQAMHNLENVAPQLSAQERAALLEKIGQLKKDVLDRLYDDFTNQQLLNGIAFADFVKKGKVRIEFEELRKRIEERFDVLTRKLS